MSVRSRFLSLALAVALIGAAPAAALADSSRVTIAGATAGWVTCVESGNDADRRIVVRLDHYENATPTPQQCRFRVPFAEIPAILVNSDPRASVNRSAIILPASMTGPVDARVIVEGFVK
jgi:hypothetical protein